MLRKRNTFPTLFADREQSDVTFSEMLDEMMENALSRGRGTFIPEMNIYEKDERFEITLALPGMSKDDIEISLEGTTITISGERKMEKEENQKYHRIESQFGKFERTIPLPEAIKTEEIDASYDNGVLTVRVPKHEEKRAKKIDVS